eukprot:CAMPEP_0172460136 /NCGR_PEP_ID=MMETSP1065-20121228/35672_1 /TAXON_ID=265537 /ORGANISM="Amphiprora paludosa, Strain CCMP125" /LENGTH=57 /DNA_ID=CAMNT_0013215073 /DNA_START=114 /DNA_END=287 /DNA_ORIENTATION=-
MAFLSMNRLGFSDTRSFNMTNIYALQCSHILAPRVRLADRKSLVVTNSPGNHAALKS